MNEKECANENKKVQGKKGRHGNIFTARIINKKEVLFDSKKEALYYDELLIKERVGIIKSLKIQHKFDLIPTLIHNNKTLRKITYKADFYFIENNKEVVVDTKGYSTDVYKIKKRLFILAYPNIIFREI